MSQEQGPHSTEPGQRRKYTNWVMWAQDGMVFLEDQDKGDQYAYTCAEAREKRDGFAEEMKAWDGRRENADPKERAYAISYYHQIRGLVVNLSDTIDDAKVQGDPSDPVVREYKLRAHIRSKRAAMGGVTTEQVIRAIMTPNNKPLVHATPHLRPVVFVKPPTGHN